MITILSCSQLLASASWEFHRIVSEFIKDIFLNVIFLMQALHVAMHHYVLISTVILFPAVDPGVSVERCLFIDDIEHGCLFIDDIQHGRLFIDDIRHSGLFIDDIRHDCLFIRLVLQSVLQSVLS